MVAQGLIETREERAEAAWARWRVRHRLTPEGRQRALSNRLAIGRLSGFVEESARHASFLSYSRIKIGNRILYSPKRLSL